MNAALSYGLLLLGGFEDDPGKKVFKSALVSDCYQQRGDWAFREPDMGQQDHVTMLRLGLGGAQAHRSWGVGPCGGWVPKSVSALLLGAALAKFQLQAASYPYPAC